MEREKSGSLEWGKSSVSKKPIDAKPNSLQSERKNTPFREFKKNVMKKPIKSCPEENLTS